MSTFMRQSVNQLETKGTGIQNIGAVSYIKDMKIPLAPRNVQEQFAAFVQQSDKSKLMTYYAKITFGGREFQSLLF